MAISYGSCWSAAELPQLVISIVAVLAITSCGSTAQWATVVGNEPSPNDLGAPNLGSRDPDTTSDEGMNSRRGVRQPDIARTTDPDSPSHSRTGDTSSHMTSRGPAASGRGFTSTEVYVGYGTENGSDGFSQSLGFESDSGDREAHAKAIVRDLNARGGLAGRKVRLVLYDYPIPGSIQNGDASAQAACERWTRDQPVFAVVNIPAFGDRTLISCLAKRRTPLISSINGLRPRALYERYKMYLYSPAWPSNERLIPVWIRRLATTGYFRGWDTRAGQPNSANVRTGLLSIKEGYGSEWTSAMRAELVRNSQVVAATYNCTCHADTISNEMSEAVLKFSQNGVTHVMAQVQMLSLFSQTAESQRYRPRYAISSSQIPNRLTNNHPNANAQYNGALGVGHIPTLDVDNARDPGHVSSAQSRCEKIMKAAGQDTTKRRALRLMVQACDGFNVLRLGIERGGLSPQGLLNGIQEIRSLAPASTFAILFTNGRADGPAAVRDLKFKRDCTCFSYISSDSHGM